MTYDITITFKPLHEAMSSLHAYICRQSHKKLDLPAAWAAEVKARLEPQFAELLDELAINADWKLTFLLVHLSPAEDASGFAAWLRGQGAGELYERLAPYCSQFPKDMAAFRDLTASVFERWEEQYFRSVDREAIVRLGAVCRERRTALADADDLDKYVDETTNGLRFEPIDGLRELVLIPQMHFQPINVIFHFRRMTICYYAARIDLREDEFLSAHDFRIIRSLGERSRLKILRFLHGGPRSFIEIVRHLQLSKGITHDHIGKLRSAGLIHAHFEGETLTVYSLRKGALERMQAALKAYIEG
ncbi:ArsR/SmtB family transcription factor [Paenibacillus pasadenensis]|uniref:ArsR/SmtB family transcription factor n=1 Tax=Paenibacillus TaxID=44249 RepID=UPI0004241193|nr:MULTISPECIES: winged helix-turn-helix domain-containing protein [Paenibacillus]QGG55374.1 ArsR family transcriptional regulator [Paenibacillus sp. B01]